ncbi:MAG: hypothetical protein FWF52_11080 [Candidatus Azobacteroides sp.]|nr:hypothetical protein [Candidatus Azobacteroides sp.]
MNDNIIFQITIEDLQNEAMERINRKLNEDEITIAKKGIEWGIVNFALDITYNTIFTEMI